MQGGLWQATLGGVHLMVLKALHLAVGVACHLLLPGLFGWTALFSAQVSLVSLVSLAA
jgi:hypothetical protein